VPCQNQFGASRLVPLRTHGNNPREVFLRLDLITSALIGFVHLLSAIPHSAMAQVGSVFNVTPKASIARANSNECSSAID
jgi:hypothetical protein